jgi:hypothetical protein
MTRQLFIQIGGSEIVTLDVEPTSDTIETVKQKFQDKVAWAFGIGAGVFGQVRGFAWCTMAPRLSSFAGTRRIADNRPGRGG